MVQYAVCKDILVFASTVDRTASSTIKSKTIRYSCYECDHPLMHVNKTKRSIEHFAHYPHNKKICKLQSAKEEMEGWSFPNLEETNTAFVKKWKQSYDYKVCLENNKVYNFGSPKGYIYVYHTIRFSMVELFRKKSISIPELFILDATKRNVEFRKLGEEYWVKFSLKCEIDYTMDYGGIAILDCGYDHVFQITREILSSEYEDSDRFYKAYPISLDLFIKTYMPDEYDISPRPTESIPTTILQLKKKKTPLTQVLKVKEKHIVYEPFTKVLKVEEIPDKKEDFVKLSEEDIRKREQLVRAHTEEYTYMLHKQSEELRLWNLAKYGK